MEKKGEVSPSNLDSICRKNISPDDIPSISPEFFPDREERRMQRLEENQEQYNPREMQKFGNSSKKFGIEQRGIWRWCSSETGEYIKAN